LFLALNFLNDDETEEHWLLYVRGTGDGFSWSYIAGNMSKTLKGNESRYANGWKISRTCE
jgi:hypothetical protein